MKYKVHLLDTFNGSTRVEWITASDETEAQEIAEKKHPGFTFAFISNRKVE